MLRAGTIIVGAVMSELCPAKAPFDSFISSAKALQHVGRVDIAVIFSPPEKAMAATLEAIDSGIRTVVSMTEYVPVHDALLMRRRARAGGALLIGPNSTGILTPRQARAGYFCDDICIPGTVGVLAKSGSVAYAALSEMKASGIGASTVASLGGDLVKGADYRDLLALFEKDAATRAVLLLGEVGGDDEEQAAAFIREHIRKPVVAFISGRAVKAGENIGHAGAIVTSGKGGHAGKVAALLGAGVSVASEFSDIVPLLKALKP
jgi:succinyl-CoA synthetase alpha subunit